jgi:glyoxylase-like metal-dependent hydrolase (beta-lactamase superfamily II)
MPPLLSTRLSRRAAHKTALALAGSAPLLLMPAAARAAAWQATPPGAGTAADPDLAQFAEDAFAYTAGGYVSFFVVTPEGVIATDPSSQAGPERAEAYKAAIASVTDQPVRFLVYSHDHADHAAGGDVFADTATFVAHANAGPKIAARNDPRTPAPQITFADGLSIDLGGKTVELRYVGRNHSDNSIVLLYPARRIMFAVDFIPVDRLPYQDLGDSYPAEWIESLRLIEETLDFDTLVPGHPPFPGTKADVAEMRGYFEDLLAAIDAARAAGAADNSPEMVEAVRAALEPDYGAWGMFAEWLPLNIEGVIRAESAAAAAAGTPAA